MFAMLEAKLPPPRPAVTAATMNIQYGVLGFDTHTTSRVHGISSSRALTTVQFRPPNLATAKVYGKRIVAPTRLGTAASQNSWSTEKSKPACTRNTALTLHSIQTEKPMCSARMDHTRFRRATFAPPPAQNSGFSGSQWSIQRPVRWVRAFGSVDSSVVVSVRVTGGSSLREGRAGP